MSFVNAVTALYMLKKWLLLFCSPCFLLFHPAGFHICSVNVKN